MLWTLQVSGSTTSRKANNNSLGGQCGHKTTLTRESFFSNAQGRSHTTQVNTPTNCTNRRIIVGLRIRPIMTEIPFIPGFIVFSQPRLFRFFLSLCSCIRPSVSEVRSEKQDGGEEGEVFAVIRRFIASRLFNCAASHESATRDAECFSHKELQHFQTPVASNAWSTGLT